MESASQQWRKLTPPILSTSHCKFNGTSSCAHARKTIPLALTHLFSKQIVSIIFSPKLIQIIFTGFWYGHYKGLPSMKNFCTCVIFHFLCLFLSILLHTFFVGLWELVNPGNIFQTLFCAFTCLSNNSLIS